MKKLPIDDETSNFNDGYIKDIDFKKKLIDKLNEIDPKNVKSISDDNLKNFREKIIIKEWDDNTDNVEYINTKSVTSNIGSILDLYCGNDLGEYTNVDLNTAPFFKKEIAYFRDFLKKEIYPNRIKNRYNNIEDKVNYQQTGIDTYSKF